jgi:hypothetical protein
MDNSIGQRIKGLLYEFRYKQVDLLKHLKWDVEERKATISYWLRQNVDPPYIEFVKGVLDVFPQINPYWLITGEGEKQISNQINPDNNQKQSLIAQEPRQTYKNEKVMNDRQQNRVIDMLEKQIYEKDKTINRLLTLIEETNKKKDVGQLPDTRT